MHPLKKFLSALALGLALGTQAAAPTPNTLTPEEKAEGWRLLFDGKSTEGWRSFRGNAFPTLGWAIEDGCIRHLPKGQGGDIITTESYQEFELRWQWKVAQGANSGVKYFILEERGQAIGHEYQMIDDERHSDAKTGPLHQTGAFYDVLPPTQRAMRPAGEWNESRIVVGATTIEHWLNGKRVLKYKLGSPEVVAGIARSKFKNVEGFGKSVPGHILLQDHGDEVWFRDIRILPKK